MATGGGRRATGKKDKRKKTKVKRQKSKQNNKVLICPDQNSPSLRSREAKGVST